MRVNDILLFARGNTHYRLLVLVLEKDRIKLENLATESTAWVTLDTFAKYEPILVGRRYKFWIFTFNLYYEEPGND